MEYDCDDKSELSYNFDLIDFGQSDQKQCGKPRAQANERERYRTHSVNSAFGTLRQILPTKPKDRKLSKIEILSLARSYISHLSAVLLTTGNSSQPCLSMELLNHDCRSSICTFCAASIANDRNK